MKNIFILLFAILVLISRSDLANAHNAHGHSDETEYGHYHVIHTRELRAMIDSGKPLVILDARPSEYDDKNRIPGATLLPYNSPEEMILAKIPSKSSTIVVYCTNKDCPASKYLAEKLVELGYTGVFKYPEGIEGWKEKGNEIQKAS